MVPTESAVAPGDTIHYTVSVTNADPVTDFTIEDVSSERTVCAPPTDPLVVAQDSRAVTTCTRLARASDVPSFGAAGEEVDVKVTFDEYDPSSPPATPVTVAFPPHGFPDVTGSEFYADAVTWARYFELVAGYNNGTFRAANAVTRGQIVNMLWHTVDEPVVNAPHGFVDVPAGAFYRQALNWAKARGLVTGFSGNRYRPNQSVTRGQLLNMVHKMVASPPLLDTQPGYSDVSPAFRTAARWARQHHLADAFAPGLLLRPTRAATRGEVVDVLHRLVAATVAWQSWNRAPVSTWLFDDAHVLIRNQDYVVDRTTVFTGESVAWEMVDQGSGTLHTVTDASIGLNEEMGQADIRFFAFDTPGTFTYHCTIHPSMTGRVTVQALP
jgi:plastocyanin